MSLSRRIDRVERAIPPANCPLPAVVITGGAAVLAQERPIVDELVRARARAAWPTRLLITQVTSDNLKAWRAGRRADAIRGIGRRRGSSDLNARKS